MHGETQRIKHLKARGNSNYENNVVGQLLLGVVKAFQKDKERSREVNNLFKATVKASLVTCKESLICCSQKKKKAKYQAQGLIGSGVPYKVEL